VSLGQGSWAVPDVTAFTEGIDRAVAMAERGDGEVIVLSAAGRSERDEQRLAELFTAERDQEWAEFIADCAKFDTEIDHAISQRKFTLAELEEEEQSLDQLRAGTARSRPATSLAHPLPRRPTNSSNTVKSGWLTTPSECSLPSIRCERGPSLLRN